MATIINGCRRNLEKSLNSGAAAEDFHIGVALIILEPHMIFWRHSYFFILRCGAMKNFCGAPGNLVVVLKLKKLAGS